MEARRDVFQAIADPTRRQIISLVSKKAMNLNAIAEKFDVSRPAISQHMKILVECGLINVQQKGRERYCEARVDKLVEVSEWVDRQRRFWTNKLDRLEEFLEQTEKSKRSKKSNHKKDRK